VTTSAFSAAVLRDGETGILARPSGGTPAAPVASAHRSRLAYAIWYVFCGL